MVNNFLDDYQHDPCGVPSLLDLSDSSIRDEEEAIIAYLYFFTFDPLFYICKYFASVNEPIAA